MNCNGSGDRNLGVRLGTADFRNLNPENVSAKHSPHPLFLLCAEAIPPTSTLNPY